ncbi:hypothetical protein BDQ17DRAFT_1312868 [Cyathus striatus]|nr:hypothetical protein BDQ17DRAFT_1312868 [Cyathus striatus]
MPLRIHKAKDIFLFTFYWILLFYLPILILSGTYAFWNQIFYPAPPSVLPKIVLDTPIILHQILTRPMPPSKPARNERRSRLSFALIILFAFIGMGLAGVVVSSAALGFATAGLHIAADLHMSTANRIGLGGWIPFLHAVTQVVVGLLRFVYLPLYFAEMTLTHVV